MKKTAKPATIAAYITSFPPAARRALQQMRKIIRAAAPHATEEISYGMPAFKADGRVLVYFAAYAGHIGFYAIPSAHEKFEKQLSRYKRGRGSVQFPLTEKLPEALIRKMVAFRLKENSAKAKKK